MTRYFDRKIAFASLLIVLAITATIHMSSCQKTDVTPPFIQLDSLSGYIGLDTSLPAGTIFSVYVTAIKAGNDQLLTTGMISHRVNGSPDSVLYNMSLAVQVFEQAYSFIAGPSGHKETFVFRFGQLDGLADSATVTITDL